MRLCSDFPFDATCWEVEDEYMFGSNLLVAPIVEPNARERKAYLPSGSTWRDAWTEHIYPGGQCEPLRLPWSVSRYSYVEKLAAIKNGARPINQPSQNYAYRVQLKQPNSEFCNERCLTQNTEFANIMETFPNL